MKRLEFKKLNEIEKIIDEQNFMSERMEKHLRSKLRRLVRKAYVVGKQVGLDSRYGYESDNSKFAETFGCKP